MSNQASRYFEYSVRSNPRIARCWLMDTLAAHTDPRALGLKRLVRERNVSAEAFLDELREGDVGELLDLVHHWLAIEDGQGRRRVLSLARQEAGRVRYRDCA